MPSIYDEEPFPISKNSRTFAAVQRIKGQRTAFAPKPPMGEAVAEHMLLEDAKKQEKKKRDRARSFYSLGFSAMQDEWPPERVTRSLLDDRRLLWETMETGALLTIGQVARSMDWVRSRADGHLKSLRIMGYVERSGEAHLKVEKEWSYEGWAAEIIED